MNKKYPYIADKRLYAAVLGAMSEIEDGAYFNQTISLYADKYSVNKEELKKQIILRQSVDVDNRKRGAYKYFVVETWTRYQRENDNSIEHEKYSGFLSVERALSYGNIMKRLNGSPYDCNEDNTVYSEDLCIVHGQFDTKEEARKALQKLFSLKKDLRRNHDKSR